MEKLVVKEKKQLTLIENKLETLMSGALGPAILGVIICLFLTYYFFGVIDTVFIASWSFLTLVGGGVRIFIKLNYDRNPNKYTAQKWLKLYLGTVNYVAALWALVPFFMINLLNPSSEVFLIILLLGMASGGAIAFVATKKTAIFYCTSINVTYAIKTLIEDKSNSYLIVMAAVIFVLLLYKTIKQFNLMYENAYFMGLEVKDKFEIEKELQQQKIKDMQNAKLASLGEMAAGIAHEINNPLTVSLGKLNKLKKLLSRPDTSTEDLKEIINSASSANNRIAQIVSSMQNLSRIKDEAESQQFSITELRSVVYPLIDIKLKTHDVELIDNMTDSQLLSDKGELSQVLINLLKNAVDAIEGQSHKWIKLSTRENDEFVEIIVMDSGFSAGIKDHDKIFDPFYTTKEVGKGTGLGLSLCRNIMRRNGGDIILAKKSEHTCFTLSVKKFKASIAASKTG
jgi:signal transduction histidine kinase